MNTSNKYHLVFFPKNQHKWIFESEAKRLCTLIKELLKLKNGMVLNHRTEKDHIYFHITIPSPLSISNIINYLKSKSSKMVNQKYYASDSKANFWHQKNLISSEQINKQQIGEYINNLESNVWNVKPSGAICWSV